MTLLDPAAGVASEALSERLLRSTARQSYYLDVDIDWGEPPVPGLWWMQPERMSLYGTPLWDRLSEEQRIELSLHEVASMVSVGIWFEVVLMQILLRDAYREDPRSARTQFMLTEVGDETRHTVMFGRRSRRWARATARAARRTGWRGSARSPSGAPVRTPAS